MSAADADGRSQALLGWPEELRVLRRFGLRDRMRLLDLGSGPGVVAAEMLRALPTATLVGVDVRGPRSRNGGGAEADATGRLAFVAGTAARLPFRDASFDFATARLVFQYLPDPTGAARDALRVLRPGGQLAMTEVDRRLSYALDPPLPELEMLMHAYDACQRARGGDRGIGGRLRAILEEAGAAKVQTETARFESRPGNAELFLDSLMGPRRIATLREGGYASRANVDDYLEARSRWLLEPGRAVTRYFRMASGTKGEP